MPCLETNAELKNRARRISISGYVSTAAFFALMFILFFTVRNPKEMSVRPQYEDEDREREYEGEHEGEEHEHSEVSSDTLVPVEDALVQEESTQLDDDDILFAEIDPSNVFEENQLHALI